MSSAGTPRKCQSTALPRKQQGQRPQEHRLAGARRAYDVDDLALIQLQRNAIQHAHPTGVAGQVDDHILGSKQHRHLTRNRRSEQKRRGYSIVAPAVRVRESVACYTDNPVRDLRLYFTVVYGDLEYALYVGA